MKEWLKKLELPFIHGLSSWFLKRTTRLRCSWININPFLSRGKPFFIFKTKK